MKIDEARDIMGENIIGPSELKAISWADKNSLINVQEIPFTKDELENKRNDYLLIYGISNLINGKKLTIRNLIEIYGKSPDIKEPCFYNQDWYEKEEFIDEIMKEGWFLIRKNVYENSRAVLPNELELSYIFPSAISCTYAFFVSWECRNEKLWVHDFVWCRDKDHNGDRIYVGKYQDAEGMNKNGFSIHRHLALRTCYGCID